MNLSLKVENTAEVQKMLAGIGKSAPKAVQRWANWIGLEAQGAMRAELPNRFHMRGTADQFRKAVIFQQATTKGDRHLQAILRIGAGGLVNSTKASASQKLGVILARHEDAETRTSNAIYRMGSAVNRGQTFQGGFFLPAKGLRTASTNPPRKLYPTSIGAQMRKGDGAGGSYFAKDKRKTSFSRKSGQLNLGESFYVVPGVGIFRRGAIIGPKAKGSRGEPLWWFKRTVRTAARLGLWETAERVFQVRAVALGQQAIEETLFRATL